MNITTPTIQSAPTRSRRAAAALAAAALASAGLAACASSDAEGSSGGSDSLFVATGGASANQMVPYLAETLGYAKEEGLDLKVKTLEANTVAAVVAGRADIAEFGAGSALAPVGEGKDTSIIVGLQGGETTGFVMAGKGIDEITQCKRLATNPKGSSAYSSAAAYKKATGATYDIVEFTTPADVAASVVSGQTDCASSSLGVLSAGLSQGLHLIIDPNKPEQIPPDSIQGTVGVSLWGMKDELQKKSAAVEKLMKALVKVQKYLETATPDEIAASLKKNSDFTAYEAAALATAVKGELPFLFPNDGRIDADQWPATLTYYKYGNPAIDPTGDVWSFDKRVDMSYMDKATSSS